MNKNNLTSKKHKIKTYEFNVRGFPTVTKTGRSRGKMIASCWYNYMSGVDDECTFKEFLKICSVTRIKNPYMKKIWIKPDMKEVLQTGPKKGNSIPWMDDDHDTPVWSHELDVSFVKIEVEQINVQ